MEGSLMPRPLGNEALNELSPDASWIICGANGQEFLIPHEARPGTNDVRIFERRRFM